MGNAWVMMQINHSDNVCLVTKSDEIYGDVAQWSSVRFACERSWDQSLASPADY